MRLSFNVAKEQHDVMKSFVFAVILVGAAVAAASDVAPENTFKNFEYPFKASAGWPDHLEWLNIKGPYHVKLKNGSWRDGKRHFENEPFRGLTLESVQLGDVTEDGKSDAIVTLRFDTGGTQYSHYVYVFSMQEQSPRLLAYFHSGDRAAAGLYRVYPHQGKLVIELFDPEKRSGDCCSDGFIRTRFQWKNLRYQRVGGVEFGRPNAQSRMPVSVFGIHQ